MSAERLTWIDTHCHLDAPEFDPDRQEVRARARAAGVGLLVLPAVHSPSLAAVQALARQQGDAYALGFHPLYVEQEPPGALQQLADALGAALDDPHLVAVGEIGLDGFVAGPTNRPAAALRNWPWRATPGCR